MKWLAAFALICLAACHDDAARGVELLKAGDAAGALRAFDASAERGSVSDELRINRALAALHAGEDDAAVASLEGLTSDGRGLPDFIRGVVSFRRALEIEATTADFAETAAFDPSVLHVRAALDAWTSALRARDDWPAARRNIERAQAFLDRAAQRTGEPPPEEPESEEAPDETEDEDVELPAHLTELPAGRVRSLLDVLAQKEREKTALREETQRNRTTGERDW